MDKIGSASLVGTTASAYGGLDQTPVSMPVVLAVLITNLIPSSIPESHTVKRR